MRISEIKNALAKGAARANLFEVQVDFPAFAGAGNASRTLAVTCKAAQMPASTLGVIEVPYRGRILKLAGDRLFDEWTITVTNDVDGEVRDAFERWSNGINAHLGNIGVEPIADYMSSATVFQIDRNGDRTKSYAMVDCWPSIVSEIEVGTESTNQLQEFTVTFQFCEWRANTTT